MMSPNQRLAFAAAVTIVLVSHVCSSYKISSLPGQPPVPFSQYSGYVTVDQAQGRALFYYFVEAEADPSSKPLVLWLNGGPGCSSVGAGAFGEHGPFQPRGNLLVSNKNSWNKEANMIYLESPAGVGFSYSSDKSYYKFVDDEMTARDNLVFLRKWLEEFPMYKDRDLFIAGESYAGHYVPQLAQLIVQSRAFNLKGIAIGNPLLEFNTDFNSRAEYFWSHGLVSDSSYENFNNICNFSQIRRQSTTGSLHPPCSGVWHQASSEIGSHVDQYDVILDVCLSTTGSQSQLLSHLGTEKVDVCVEDETYTYLNRKDVQRALHARLVGVGNWSVCSDVLNYNMQELEVPTIPILGTLVKSGIRVLVYSGDQDSVIPLLGTRTLVHGLAKGLGLNTSTPYRAWFQDKQVAGWTQAYGDNLAYATIRGAAHEAPFSQPERSLVLFSSFVTGKPLPNLDHNKHHSLRSGHLSAASRIR
ncbi:hypothetical protein MLD38_030992 [Melastoma candidum]|uniref:Uncharacterized protein n=1 Tax=Melastoma candidum TaxID=119954 RepID=A0ACB9MTC5_9MYRT|nr:hypothetical protein MLD38_030992 [Melastoma candidum]